MKYVLAMAMFLVFGCNKNANIDIGELKDNKYTNAYLNLSVPLPDGWSAQDDESRKKIMMQGLSMYAGDDKNLAALLKSGQVNTINMFLFSKHPLGTPTDFNHNIAGIAENIKLYAEGIKSGKDYFFHLKKSLNQGNISVNIVDSSEVAAIGGKSFDVLDITMDFGGRSVKQRYYCSIVNGFAVCFIVSFVNPEQKEELGKVIGTIKL